MEPLHHLSSSEVSCLLSFFLFSFSFITPKDPNVAMAISMFSLFLVLVAAAGPLLYNAVRHHLTVLGVYRSPTFVSSNQDIHKIPDTLQCEDIHYYTPGKLIFAACEDSVLPRFQWFPPLDHLDKPPETPGSIHIIDPQVNFTPPG